MSTSDSGRIGSTDLDTMQLASECGCWMALQSTSTSATACRRVLVAKVLAGESPRVHLGLAARFEWGTMDK